MNLTLNVPQYLFDEAAIASQARLVRRWLPACLSPDPGQWGKTCLFDLIYVVLNSGPPDGVGSGSSRWRSTTRLRRSI